MNKLSKEIKEKFLLEKEYYKIPVTEEEIKHIMSLNEEDREKYINENNIKDEKYFNEHEYYRARELSDKDAFFILQQDIASYLRTIKNIMIFFLILTIIPIIIFFINQ